MNDWIGVVLNCANTINFIAIARCFWVMSTAVHHEIAANQLRMEVRKLWGEVELERVIRGISSDDYRRDLRAGNEAMRELAQLKEAINLREKTANEHSPDGGGDCHDVPAGEVAGEAENPAEDASRPSG